MLIAFIAGYLIIAAAIEAVVLYGVRCIVEKHRNRWFKKYNYILDPVLYGLLICHIAALACTFIYMDR